MFLDFLLRVLICICLAAYDAFIPRAVTPAASYDNRYQAQYQAQIPPWQGYSPNQTPSIPTAPTPVSYQQPQPQSQSQRALSSDHVVAPSRQDRQEQASAAVRAAASVATTATASSSSSNRQQDTVSTSSTEAHRAHSFPSSNQRAINQQRRDVPIIPSRKNINKIYPALLSKVAEVFKSQLVLSEKVKDDLTYTEAFDGSQAVDLLCQIVRTNDRNIALLLGRCLDAQKFFHDVHWEHRLRDSEREIYRFKERIPSPIFNDNEENNPVDIDDDDDIEESETPIRSGNSLEPNKVIIPSRSASMPSRSNKSQNSINRKDQLATSNKQPRSSAPINFNYSLADEANKNSSSTMVDELPTGVFTLLTACYSPTCTKDRLCYSITCPRRIEQQHRMANRGSIKPQDSIKRSKTKKVARNVPTHESVGEEPVIEETITEGLNELNVGVGEAVSDNVVKAELGSSSNIASDRAPGTLWVDSVPKEVVESCSSEEIKRQEAINEVIYTEQDFVRDLEYLRDVSINFLNKVFLS